MKRFPLLLLLAATLTLDAQAQVTAIKAGQLVDPAAGTSHQDQVILVEDGVVTAVGPALEVPAGATVIDLSDAVVLPGLVDAHTHVCLILPTVGSDSPHPLYEELLFVGDFTSTGYRAIQGVANARAMLDAGFTTIRDVGNAANYADTDLRRAIEDGLVDGPTIVSAGRIIAPLGGQYEGVLHPERPGAGRPEYIFADTRDELKKAIRENVLYGATVIKIVVDDQPYTYSVDDIRFVVEEAGRAGLKVAAHAATERGARDAIEAGVASIEHGYEMSDETLEMGRENGVVLVGTDFTEEIFRGYGSPPGAHTAIVDRLRRAYRVGMPIAFGSDVVIDLPGYTCGTLSMSMIDSFVEAGIPDADILRMMTTNVTELLGIEDERGRSGRGSPRTSSPRLRTHWRMSER